MSHNMDTTLLDSASTDGTARVQSYLQQMEDIFTTKMAQMEEKYTTQQQIIEQQQQQLNKMSTMPPKPTVQSASLSDLQDMVKPKERLPTMDKFTGRRSEWDEWCLHAQNKLMVDGEAIGSPFNQFVYLYSRLGGDAAKTTKTHAQKLSQSGLGNAEDFLAYLETIYGDPNKRQRANQQLGQFKQGSKESFASFLPKFEALMATAGASELADEQKIGYLQNAINATLTDKLCGYHHNNDWARFVSKCMTISSDLQAMEAKKYNKYSSGYVPKSTNRQNDAMEWEPTHSTKVYNTNTTSNGKRAKWVTKDVIQYRMSHKACLRCGGQDHMVSKCKYLPPINPNRATTSVNQMSVYDQDLGQAETDLLEGEDVEEEAKDLLL